jgi:hypothetical protein
MGERKAVMRVIERIAEHYDVQEVPFGKDYRWSPEQVVVECSNCAKRTTYKRSQILGSEVLRCECGKANTATIREELVIRLIDEEYEAHHHPWRYWHTTKDTGIPV